MRVVDTSVWIEWFTGSALGRRLGKQIPDRSECIVPTIVQLELAQWLLREAGEEQGALCPAAQASMRPGAPVRAAQFMGHGVQPAVARPQPGAAGERCGHQQVHVHVSNALAVQLVAVDVAENLVGFGHRGHWEILQQLQAGSTGFQAATGDLTHHERMPDDGASFEQGCKPGVARAQVFDPHRGVDEDQGSATPRCDLQVGLAAPQPGQSLGALALDQRLEPLANQRRSVQRPRQSGGLGQKFFVDIDGGAHFMPPQSASNIASIDDSIDAARDGVDPRADTALPSIGHPIPRLATVLFEHADLAHDHAAVDRLAHVVDLTYDRG